jgi:hypothetical protein
MNNIGWKPDFLIAQAQFYDPKTIKAARTVSFPPTWVYLNSWPFELADQNPAARAIIDILHARHPTAPLTDFTGLAFNAWLLWADAARTCGSQLTVGCVLDHAASYPAWTAGGFVAPRNTDPADAHQSECFLMMRVTPQGFVYDRKTTAPNDGIYNCSPANVVPLTG